MPNRKQNKGSERLDPLTNPEHGTVPNPDASVQRKVGERTPERREQDQLRETGTEDVEALDNITWENTAPKQTTGGPAEVDHVPNIDEG